jgi:hypothetical protein
MFQFSHRACRMCGCSENDACVDRQGRPCSWVAFDLCSHCAGRAERRRIALLLAVFAIAAAGLFAALYLAGRHG